MKTPPVSAALAEILEKTGELDRLLDGRGLEFTPAVQIGPPPGPPQPLYIEPPDWDEERRERLEAERAARIAAARADLEALEEEPAKPTPPAAKQSRWRRGVA